MASKRTTKASKVKTKAPHTRKGAAWVSLRIVALQAAEPNLGPDALVERINGTDNQPTLMPIFIEPLMPTPSRMSAASR